jgi:hypothetical protein
MAYLIPFTALQRTRLMTLLQEVAGEDAALDAIMEQMEQARQVADAEAQRRIAMETDDSDLDWAWVEQLRQEWSQASTEPWTTAEVLAVVMGTCSKSLWQPRSA